MESTKTEIIHIATVSVIGTDARKWFFQLEGMQDRFWCAEEPFFVPGDTVRITIKKVKPND